MSDLLNNKIKEALKHKLNRMCDWKVTLKLYPELFNYIERIFINEPHRYKKISEVVYIILNDLDVNNLPKCKTCNKDLPILKIIRKQYYCCKYCSDHSIEKSEKIKKTKSTEEYKQKVKHTCLSRYGVDNPTKCKDISKKISEKHKTHSPEYKQEIIDKRNKTFLEKYGVTHALLSTKIVNRMKEKELILYGVEHHTKRSGYKKIFEKLTYDKFKRFSKYVVPLFSFEEFNQMGANPYITEFKWKCCKCNNEFYSKITRHKNYIPRCIKCYPSSISIAEDVIIDFFKKYNLEDIKKSDRTVIAPRELDIVIPSKKIAIEFNGNYWHNELTGCPNNYHLEKTNKCLEQGYRLIHIFEDEWKKQQKVVKARLKAILNLTKYKIYARKCTVKILSIEDKRNFINKYHIQGDCVDMIRLGLFYKNRLVAVMTFGVPRFSKKPEQIELIRYCTIANFNIIGGAEKLLAYFRKNFISFKSIISYADKRWSIGNLYKQLGFTLIRETGPNYWYIHCTDLLIRYSRMEFQKHKLKDKLSIFDENLTEVENMRNNGYTRIFDCGNYVFELKN